MDTTRAQALLELAQAHGLDLYAYGGPLEFVVACASPQCLENLGRFLERTEQLETALANLLEFHGQDSAGHAVPRAYWSESYLEAVETAEKLLSMEGGHHG